MDDRDELIDTIRQQEDQIRELKEKIASLRRASLVDPEKRRLGTSIGDLVHHDLATQSLNQLEPDPVCEGSLSIPDIIRIELAKAEKLCFDNKRSMTPPERYQ